MPADVAPPPPSVVGHPPPSFDGHPSSYCPPSPAATPHPDALVYPPLYTASSTFGSAADPLLFPAAYAAPPSHESINIFKT